MKPTVTHDEGDFSKSWLCPELSYHQCLAVDRALSQAIKNNIDCCSEKLVHNPNVIRHSRNREDFTAQRQL